MSAAVGWILAGAGILSGGLLWFWYLQSLIDWLGSVFGLLVAVLVIPGAVVFPLIYWLVEGHIPTLYLAVFGAGTVCIIVGGILLSRSR